MTVYPIDLIRAAFPAMKQSRTAYLDNPAGTLVPEPVIDAVAGAMATASANLGGRFAASERADAIWRAAHEAAAEFVNARSWQEMIIGPNMTTLAFQMSRVIGKTLVAGDEIIVTRMDHEGNISPWLAMAEEHGLVVKWLAFDKESWRIEPEDLAALLTSRTKFLALNYASNMTGSINDVTMLTEMARSAGALVWIDAVQLAPHRLPDVQAIGCDFLACSSYKFFGPHMGIVWGRRAVLETLTPYKCRCSSNGLPERFETGTPQIELMAGLTATVDHFAELGAMVGATGSRRQRIAAAYAASIGHEAALATRLIDGLLAVDGLAIHGIADPARVAERVPTVSFTVDGIRPDSLVRLMAAENVFVWSGHNYAWEIVHQLGIPADDGVVRIGAAAYNTPAEIDEAVDSVRRNVAMLRQQRG